MKIKGMSLIGVLVAAGVSGIVLVTIVQMLNISFKGQRTVEVRQGTEEFRALTVDLLRDGLACRTTFAGVNPNGTGATVMAVKNGAGVDVYTAPAIYPGTITLEEIRIHRFDTNIDASSDFRGRSLVTLTFNTPAENDRFGVREIKKNIFIKTELFSSGPNRNKIERCNAIGGDTEQFWTQTPAADLYYNLGNVGIGNITPQYALHVTGFVGGDVITLPDAQNITWDASRSNYYQITLGGNRRLANPSNLGTGEYLFIINQDNAGNRTLDFGNEFVFPGSALPVINSASRDVTILHFLSNGSTLYFSNPSGGGGSTEPSLCAANTLRTLCSRTINNMQGCTDHQGNFPFPIALDGFSETRTATAGSGVCNFLFTVTVSCVVPPGESVGQFVLDSYVCTCGPFAGYPLRTSFSWAN